MSAVEDGPAFIKREDKPAFGLDGRFKEMIDRARSTPDKAPPSDASLEIAADLVAVTYFQPLLRQMRELQQAPPPFGPSQAEKQMAALMDERLSTEMARGSQLPIIDRLARDIDRLAGKGDPDAGAPFAESTTVAAESAKGFKP